MTRPPRTGLVDGPSIPRHLSSPSGYRLGASFLTAGSLLFAAYAILFPILLPLSEGRPDFGVVVRHANWRWLAATAFLGILCMLAGFPALHARIRGSSGWLGRVGFACVEAAYLLQACRVSWELFVYPVVAGHPESAALLCDGLFWHDPGIAFFSQASSLVILAGVLLFGAALWRSACFPRAAPSCWVIGALVYAAGTMTSVQVARVGILVLTVGCLQLARALWQARGPD